VDPIGKVTVSHKAASSSSGTKAKFDSGALAIPDCPRNRTFYGTGGNRFYNLFPPVLGDPSQRRSAGCNSVLRFCQGATSAG